jgi:SAM-dependent methyltransferase
MRSSTKKEWFEYPAFWKAIEDDMFNDARIRIAKQEVQWLIKLLRLAPRSDVLDLCCGIGRHSLEFAKLGHSVVGVDITRRYLERAARDATRQNIVIKLIQKDIRDYKEHLRFDLIVCLFNSFGYFSNRSDDERVLQNVYSSLKAKGTFVLSLVGYEWFRSNSQKTTIKRKKDLTIIKYKRVSADGKRLINHWQLKKVNGLQSYYTFQQQIYTKQSIIQLLRQQGFHTCSMYSAFDGKPYRDGKQAIIVAEK